jgi:SAM-dependent methyltransferase
VRTRVRPEFFERLYTADADPWGFETSAYERAKYDATIAALPDRPIASALEVGCSIGVLTERLARHADRLLAVDVSDTALARARERLKDARNVTVERRELPEDMPAGPFDLVVCSEVLYYLDDAAFDATLDGIARALQGSLVAVHWRHETERYPLLGDEVHRRLAARFGPPSHAAWTDDYALDRFELARGPRSPSPAEAPPHSRPRAPTGGRAGAAT